MDESNCRQVRRTGIKINTYPMPDPPKIHTERDNLSNVDFGRAYLAYKTATFPDRGNRAGEELKPPDTVNFWRKDKALFGSRPTAFESEPGRPGR